MVLKSDLTGAAVSTLVCTRNRPASLVRTVRSLLANSTEPFELIVIDQSDSAESEQALAPFAGDSRLRYVRSAARGKGAALNEGLRLARGEFVACTDDDCEAPQGWVSDMARTMRMQPTAAVVFCNVTGGTHDRAAGYVPAYERGEDRLLRSVGDARNGLGLGAGMALRREAVLAFGGFDETFGPGGRFASGDDWDISIRALLRGWHVYDTASVSILHHGFRTLAEGRVHALRDWIAIGALCAKPLRAGYFGAIVVPIKYFSVYGLWPPVWDLLRLRRPSGGARIVGFVRGFTQGLRTPVDRKTLLFRSVV
jgi:glycosyltransferase involved in cell wall biosynthesis